MRRGFTVDQVVHDYGDVCQAVTELAVELDSPFTTDEFRTLNKCLDDAIADAVTAHARRHNQLVEDEHTERLGYLARELRILLDSASLAFGALSSGNVGIGGATGAVLGRSLKGMRTLVDRTLTDVRLDAGAQNRELFAVAAFVEDVRVAAVMDGNARRILLVVPPVNPAWIISADKETLASVMANLLQNAGMIFTPLRGVKKPFDQSTGSVRGT